MYLKPSLGYVRRVDALPQRVLAVGDLMVELCFVVSNAWSTEPDIPVIDQRISCGGSAANFSACLAQLDQPVRLLSQVGSDDFGNYLLEDLANYRVPLADITRLSGPSSVTAIIIGSDGDRRFLSYRTPAEVDYSTFDAASVLSDCGWLHISGFVFQRADSATFARQLVEVAHDMGITVSIDPSPLFAEYVTTDPALLPLVDYLFPNEYEARALTGLDDPVAAARELHARGVGTAIVTIGPGGCVLVGGQGTNLQLATPAVSNVVDSTGAGDAFAAGFIAAIQAGQMPQAAATLGMHVAASVIAQIGGHCGAPSRQQLLASHPELAPILARLAQSTTATEGA